MTIQRKLRVALAMLLVCTTLHGVYADCVDDTEYRFLKIGTNRLGRCKYLTRKDRWARRSLYCDTTNADGVLVKEGCPAACRNCPDVCKDSAQTIEIKNWKGKTINKVCAWFSRRPDTNRKWKYCQDLAVQAHCPVTCSTCPPSAPVAPTPSPVSLVAPAPFSAQPTYTPTTTIRGCPPNSVESNMYIAGTKVTIGLTIYEYECIDSHCVWNVIGSCKDNVFVPLTKEPKCKGSNPETCGCVSVIQESTRT